MEKQTKLFAFPLILYSASSPFMSRLFEMKEIVIPLTEEEFEAYLESKMIPTEQKNNGGLVI